MQLEMSEGTVSLLSAILVVALPLPLFTRGCALKGAALTVLERYEDAEKAYEDALALGPTDPNLHAALRQTREAFGSDPSFAPGPGPASTGPVRRVHPATALAPDDPMGALVARPLHLLC